MIDVNSGVWRCASWHWVFHTLVTDIIRHTHSLTDCPKALRTSAFREETFLEWKGHPTLQQRLIQLVLLNHFNLSHATSLFPCFYFDCLHVDPGINWKGKFHRNWKIQWSALIVFLLQKFLIETIWFTKEIDLKEPNFRQLDTGSGLGHGNLKTIKGHNSPPVFPSGAAETVEKIPPSFPLSSVNKLQMESICRPMA